MAGVRPGGESGQDASLGRFIPASLSEIEYAGLGLTHRLNTPCAGLGPARFPPIHLAGPHLIPFALKKSAARSEWAAPLLSRARFQGAALADLDVGLKTCGESF
jgi:hypothetical protein